jgi:Mn-dependent DtxR family transcriptional regulator
MRIEMLNDLSRFGTVKFRYTGVKVTEAGAEMGSRSFFLIRSIVEEAR